ncbi:hypothetical protein INT46_007034 [Mucor plumbeus]|uniref:SWIM-type domain-containing protein n=1 Tax=Mucor plumbeus TaxID=97098 RepID=A0A8H7QVX7_9FUNG|nr:hypothetical protein INT46_007034 [Mucor plumbeus]
METQILHYDLLWLQSIPSISHIYYSKYLKETHLIHSPNKDQPIRAVARSIMKVMKQNQTKKIALYFEIPCSETRRAAIFNFILKHMPDITCFCLSVPCTPIQPNLLLGWSAALDNHKWKEHCSIMYNSNAFESFQPPTVKSGQSECNDFSQTFAISGSIFNKEALIVHFTNSLISFNADQGLTITENARNSIQGWIETCQHQFKTLIWIIDEKMLYGDVIYDFNPERRETLLQQYRDLVSETIQSFNSIIPVYCYILDYFHETTFNLLECIAQLQHRHNLCISKSILLTWSNEETKALEQQDFYNISRIYLQQQPLFNISKWKSIHQSFLDDKPKNDKLHYFSPDTLLLNIEFTDNLYRIPLLENKNNELPLTKSEEITRSVRHTVSAKNIEVFDNWVESGSKVDFEPIMDTVIVSSLPSTGGVQPFKSIEKPTKETSNEIALRTIVKCLTIEKINVFIGNPIYIERGIELKNQVTKFTVSMEDNENLQINGHIPIGSSNNFTTSTIFFTKENGIFALAKAKCTCPIGNWGNCKHCAAVLLYALDERSDLDEISNEANLSLSVKRSYDASEEDNTSSSNNSRKKANSSVESYDSVSTVAYDPSFISPIQASNSTDEEGLTQLPFNSNLSSISTPSLQSVRSVVVSSNERSSYSQISSSNDVKSIISLPSLPSSSSQSNSLSDNQQLKESLDQIDEAQDEEDEKEQEVEVYIEQTLQVNYSSPEEDVPQVDEKKSEKEDNELEDTQPIIDTYETLNDN